MCDFSGKLIAWLDHELPADEAAEVELHLQGCSECRSDVDAYKRVSSEFEAYCDDTIASNVRRKARRWVPVVSAAGAVAAVVALFLALPRSRVQRPEFDPPRVAVAASPAVVAKVLLAPGSRTRRVHRRQVATPVQSQDANSAFAQNQNAYFPPDESVIQIAIPAEEMFPPGAVPEGMHFVADLTIAADGSAERLRLRPRLVGFERRTTQP
jgi:anti-sigma factor RsiW